MIELIRFVKSHAITLGRLRFGDNDYFTVERPWKDNQTFVSCVPDGTYKMVRVDSPKFGDNMWEIAAVHARTHILIHVANTPSNVMGCIGLGQTIYQNLNGVGSSRLAIDDFYEATKQLTETEICISTGAL